MKKLLYILGFTSVFFITLGTLFRLMHWPGASLTLLFGNILFGVLFIPLFCVNGLLTADTPLLKIAFGSGFFSISGIFTGVFFKVMHWPGASQILIFSTILFLFITLPFYTISSSKNLNMKFRDFIFLVFFAVIANLFLLFYGLNYTRPIFDTFIKLEETLISNKNNIERLNSNYYLTFDKFNMLSNVNNNSILKLKKGADELISYIEELKIEVITIAEGQESPGIYDHTAIFAIDNYDIPNEVFFGKNNADILKKAISEYNDLILEIYDLNEGDNVEEFKKYLIKLAPPYTFRYHSNVDWSEFMFYNTPLIGVITLLTSIELEIRNSENFLLEELINQSIKH